MSATLTTQCGVFVCRVCVCIGITLHSSECDTNQLDGRRLKIKESAHEVLIMIELLGTADNCQLSSFITNLHPMIFLCISVFDTLRDIAPTWC